MSKVLTFRVAILALIFWLLGAICGLGLFRFWNQTRTVRALKAAPLISKVTAPLSTAQSMQRIGPPQYSSLPLWKTQAWQSIPSIVNEPVNSLPSIAGPPSAGTVGRAAGPTMDVACGRVDAWLPVTMMSRKELRTPNPKDPNTSISLDIMPPPKGLSGDSATSVYHHYGNPSD